MPLDEGLAPGIERTDEFEVEDRLLTDVGGTIGTKLLSTPGMIAMMERNAAILAFRNLPDGHATVGFEICIKHVAPAAEGTRCSVHAKLRGSSTTASCDSTSRCATAIARSASAPTSGASSRCPRTTARPVRNSSLQFLPHTEEIRGACMASG